MGMNPGPTALVDMPNGSTAAFQLAVLGTELVDDFDFVVDLDLVEFVPDRTEAADEVVDFADLIEGAVLVEPPSSVGLL